MYYSDPWEACAQNGKNFRSGSSLFFPLNSRVLIFNPINGVPFCLALIRERSAQSFGSSRAGFNKCYTTVTYFALGWHGFFKA